jgi:putative sterol carrier protein
MSNVKINDLINLLPNAFLPEMAGDIQTVIQINATGDDGGEWVVEIKDKKCLVEKGIAQSPDLSLTASTQVVNDIFTGKINAMRAFMQGKVQFKGNMGQAMKIVKLFSTDKKIFDSLK